MDPRRWTEEGAGATSLERELLTAGQSAGLSEQQKQEAWAGILHQLPPATALPVAGASEGGAAGAGAAGAAAVSGGVLGINTFLKVVGIAAVLGALGGGSWAVLGGDGNVREVASASPVAAQALPLALKTPETSESSPSEALAGPEDKEGEQGLPRGTVPPKSDTLPQKAEDSRQLASTDQASRLREETLAVLEIRRTLRGGDPAGALRLLSAAQKNLAGGMLGQEREALLIEALGRSGAREEAAQRANAFLKKYPRSPYASDVKAFASP